MHRFGLEGSYLEMPFDDNDDDEVDLEKNH